MCVLMPRLPKRKFPGLLAQELPTDISGDQDTDDDHGAGDEKLLHGVPFGEVQGNLPCGTTPLSVSVPPRQEGK